MYITQLHTLSDQQISELLQLMKELNSELTVTPAMLEETARSARLYAMIDDSAASGADSGLESEHSHNAGSGLESEHSHSAGSGPIIGTATLIISASPTGRKAHIEDVVVSSAYRGQHLGKTLLEHLLNEARQLSPIAVHLTSRPSRVAANNLYQSLGFIRRDTNVYKLEM